MIKNKSDIPKQHGFFYIELLSDGNLQCVCWWDNEVINNEDVKNQYLMIADYLASGGFNETFANVALSTALNKNQGELGEELYNIFESHNTNKLAILPSDVFNNNNPRKAPFGVTGE